MNRGDFRNENKFERARERVPLLPVRSRLGVIIFLATADRPFGPTIKQTIDRPFESNYKLVLPFSRLSNTLRSLSSRGQNLPLSLSYFHFLRFRPFPSFFSLRRVERRRRKNGPFETRSVPPLSVRLTFLPGESSLVRDFPETARPFSPRLSFPRNSSPVKNRDVSIRPSQKTRYE